MGLLNPLALLGLAALAVPLWVHLVDRQDLQRRLFPSLMFVRRVPFAERRRRRLRDRALLALRCLAAILIALAFAAPYLERAAGGVPPAASAHDVVVLLDRSYSMSHEGRWRAALGRARARIDDLGAGERAALVVFDESARVVQALTGDIGRLRAALSVLEPGERGTRYAVAFDEASRILGAGGAARRSLAVVSDLQRTGLAGGADLALAEDVNLEILAVTGELGPNAAVTGAELVADRDRGAGNALATLAVRVRNTGDAPLAGGRLTLAVDGLASEPQALELAAGEARTLRLPVLLARTRPTRVIVEVGPDRLSADNRQHLVLAPPRPVDVILLEPDRPRANQGLFIEQALGLARMPEVRVRRVSVSDLAVERLEGGDVVIVDDLDLDLPGDTAGRALAAFAQRGGGVLAVAGEATRTWPRDYLPGTLGPAASLPGAGARIAVVAPDHPIWAALGDRDRSAFDDARVASYRRLVPGPDDQVVARLDHGDALILERAAGPGRVLALATTLDPHWSTLALAPGFVPLMHATAAYLARREPPVPAFVLGAVIDLARHAASMPGGEGSGSYLRGGGTVVVRTPSGRQLSTVAGRVAAFVPRESGFHEVHGLPGSAAPLALAVNPPRRESLLAALDEGAFAAAVVRRPGNESSIGSEVAADSALATARAQRSGWVLLALAAVLLLLESAYANRLARGRA